MRRRCALCARSGCQVSAAVGFRFAQIQGISAPSQHQDALTIYLSALRGCGGARDLDSGRKIHADAVQAGDDSNVFLANTLISMYGKCGSMADAYRVFQGMDRPDVVSWSALVLGFAENGEEEQALDLFSQMEEWTPNSQTFVAAVKACSNLAFKESGKLVTRRPVKIESLKRGMEVHSRAARRGYVQDDIFVAGALVDFYANCGSVLDSRMVLDRTRCHNAVLWNALVLGLAENGEAELALEVFSAMPGSLVNARSFVAALKAMSSIAAKQVGKEKMACLEKSRELHARAAKLGYESDIYLANTLVDLYAKCGSTSDARDVFDRMTSRSVVSWGALVLGYVETGNATLALKTLSRMQDEGFTPSALVFVAALKACCGVTLELGRTIHGSICKGGLEQDSLVTTSLIDLYSKCGSMDDAQRVFDGIAERDLVCWNALSTGYSRQGFTTQVFELFSQMLEEGLQPNSVTFLAVLTACNHGGLVSKGRRYFDTMSSSRFGISPGIEHYHSVIDILGRANLLEEAVAMVTCMPHKPNAVTWRTVMSACHKWKNEAVARLAFDAIVEIDESDAASYMLMANSLYENRDKVPLERRTVS
ncbi:pentatricopeptide repeat-containing protein At2g13600-like [Selaginella moellendorffii]|uniref:pentatricopeptide repeat-containing protein At2g13600-like n=1 Tax=Selaginella moellendorffii TaxID=88036 RepID=UPI000D1C75E9|nr:pentatricopeptide repeat-containing protein At2g13600-like [Selaginella moellendorffii]|eukprot:XP_024520634.1 pentatricopeptide repeat-containing protein At2g13600-like [Selaginella moellendorffii]